MFTKKQIKIVEKMLIPIDTNDYVLNYLNNEDEPVNIYGLIHGKGDFLSNTDPIAFKEVSLGIIDMRIESNTWIEINNNYYYFDDVHKCLALYK